MTNECGQLTYVKHLMTAHHRLDHLLCQTVQSLRHWASASSAEWPPHLLAALGTIRAELVHHFTEEESGGCLEEAVARCPALAQEADSVEAEHGQLLEVLDELTNRCQQLVAPTRQDAIAVEEQLRGLAHQLHVHEGHENHIMQQAFSVCLENVDGQEPEDR